MNQAISRSRIQSVLVILFMLLALTGCHSSSPSTSTSRPGAGAGTDRATSAASQPAQRNRGRSFDPDAVAYIRASYSKSIHEVAMRDGVRLHTIVYSPKDDSRKYPILLMRTPYSIGPYGEGEMPESLGPSAPYVRSGYIFALQDVRGKFMSEGEFVNMRPHIDQKNSPRDVDESSDTFDTVDWLVKNVSNNNGRVGQWGISYPGFYSSAGMIDAHPALKAVSPQAPIADWFFDDFYHHGAFFLPHAFNFFASFGKPRPNPTTQWSSGIQHGTSDGYQFFLDLGPLRNADVKYYKGEIGFWTDITQHPAYDGFWQSRNLLPHLKHVAPAVLVVGGWFDAEDLYGALNTYQAIERQNPGVANSLVMGPWRHGGWNRSDGDRLGNISFGAKTADFYRTTIEFPFFEHYLKDAADPKLPEAYVFETGVNQWQTFDHWPPTNLEQRSLYLQPHGRLSFDPPGESGSDSFVSDPAKPVPFSETIGIGMTPEYMTDDQRFAARRPDVLTYQTDVLTENITLAGPMLAQLWVSTSGTDADWVVKLIDVFPPDAEDGPGMAPNRHLGGYQMMVRSEAIRGRYRGSYSAPEPFVPNEPTYVPLPLQDVLHTFQSGHRIMVQIQSTWFPLMDRNPQRYVRNIFEAQEGDFQISTHRVYRESPKASKLQIGVWRQNRPEKR